MRPCRPIRRRCQPRRTLPSPAGTQRRTWRSRRSGPMREAEADGRASERCRERKRREEKARRLCRPTGLEVYVSDAYVGGNSDPRNETMMKMFSLINVGERAGGGIPDMVKKWTSAGYGKPVLSEQVNPERSTIVLPLRKRVPPQHPARRAHRLHDGREPPR